MSTSQLTVLSPVSELRMTHALSDSNWRMMTQQRISCPHTQYRDLETCY